MDTSELLRNPLFIPLLSNAVACGLTERDLSRFLVKIEVTETCWLWTAAAVRYGEFNLRGRIVKAHRLMWELAHGSLDPSMCVCHRCDVTICVNPAHLFVGSQADNVHDMIAKQRDRKATGNDHWSKLHPDKILRGILNGMAKIGPEQVREIRASKDTISALSRKYQLGRTQIKRIRTRESWSDVH